MTDIEPCIVHMTDYDHDCQACKDEVTQLEFRVRNAAEANAEIEKRLHALGQPVSMLNVMHIRLNTLIESATGGNPKVRSRFEEKFMANYGVALAEADKQLARARLTQGIRITPGG